MIKIKNLTKKFGEKPVVKDVSVHIQKGKITSFIGPNGAGKSTLLSAVSRLIKHDIGEIFIEDKEIKKWKNNDLSKKIAILRQSNFLNEIGRASCRERVDIL